MQEHYRITVTHPDGNKSQYFYSGMTGTGWYVSPRDYVEYVDANTNNNATNVPKTVYTYATTVKGGREEIASIVTPEGKKTTYTYDYDTGQVISVTDNYNNTISYTYNELGRVTSITPEVGAVTNYIYDESNNFDLEEIEKVGLGSKNIAYNSYHQPTQYEDMNGNITQVTYNSYGQIESQSITVDGQTVETAYIYYESADSSAYRLKEIRKNNEVIMQYTYDTIGRIQTFLDATGLLLTYAYNDLNQMTRVDFPDGKNMSIGYSSCCPFIKDYITDRSGLKTAYIYDANKRLSEVVAPGGDRTQYYYDANGNLTRLIDAKHQVTEFEYDLDNRLIEKRFADGKSTTFEYKANGLMSKRVNARGITTDYDYDGNQRLITVHYSDSTPSVTYQYDDYGRIIQMRDGLGTTQYTYDKNSNVLSVDGPWSDDTVTYQYDEMNRRTNITPQIGQAISYKYDSMYRLIQVQTGTELFDYTYKSSVSPLVDRLTRPNNSYTDYDFNAIRQLISIDSRNSTNDIIISNTFNYNEKDMKGSETFTTNNAMSGFQSGLTNYHYNVVNQLLESNNPDQTLGYDDDGNMIDGYTPNGYNYTATYDGESRLATIEFTDGGGVIHKTQFRYDGNSFVGEVTKYENNSIVDETRIVRDGALPLQDRDGTNSIVREYTWGLNKGGGIGGLLSMRQGGQRYYYIYDGKGNVSAVTNSSDSVVAAYRYDSFGRVTVKSGTLDQPIQFSTKRYITNLGLNYYGYRFYSSSIGRWISRDPIGEKGGINLYAFVLNNAVNNIDPFGLISDSAKCGLTCGTIAVAVCAYFAPTVLAGVLCGLYFVVVCTFGCDDPDPCGNKK
jgi:RHS repeat-associated protein